MHAIASAIAPSRLHVAALALAGACATAVGPARAADNAGAPAAPASAPALQPSTTLQPLPRGEAGRHLPIVLQASRISGQPDLLTQGEGDVEFRRGGLVVQADRLSYDAPQDRAHGVGHVRISREGAVYTGPELMLDVQRFEGHFLSPTFEFLRMGTSGRADRIDFLGNARSRAAQASYTSCPLGSGEEPDWELRMRSVEIDVYKRQMPSSAGVACCNAATRSCASIRRTRRPMKTGISVSMSATTRPVTNIAPNRPRAWLTKCQ